ncbi:hypothetical protein EYF80_004331 [Liparis tanakae]|uniref:Uncharacterized protein n=1 Tax=Liparis tanakae TaxID=230148 RepID=A0A4Z2J533_9TELE|nr:hypothetical protein EYF80_004331 [Liparis tanakae]
MNIDTSVFFVLLQSAQGSFVDHDLSPFQVDKRHALLDGTGPYCPLHHALHHVLKHRPQLGALIPLAAAGLGLIKKDTSLGSNEAIGVSLGDQEFTELSYRTPSRMALRPLGLCRHGPPARRPLSTPPIRASTGHTSVQRAASLVSDRVRRGPNKSPVSSAATPPSLSFSSLSECVGLKP